MSPNETVEALLQQRQKVTEIIQLLADKATFEQRLNAITAIAQTADKKMRDASAQAEKYGHAERMLSQATAMLADHTAREAKLQSREASVSEREAAVAEREMKFKSLATIIK